MLDLALPESWSWDQFIPMVQAASFKQQASSLTVTEGFNRMYLERINYD